MTATALAAPDAVAPLEPGADPDTGRFGMWVFLASEILFFGGLFVAYLYGRTHWPQGFAFASRHTDVVLGTVNTAVLLTSSAAVALAVACAESRRQRRWAARLLVVTAFLGTAFLVVKGFEYRAEWQEHLFPGRDFALADTPGAQEFFALYFVMTGLHGMHMIVGIGVLAVFAQGRRRRRDWADARHVEVAALYWHFVDLIWIFLYPLLYLVERHG
jgi:cytochrome c oxidase subunit 3